MSDASLRVAVVGPGDFAECRRIRHEVFVVDQGVAMEIEFDGLDEACTHFLAWREERAVGTARLRPVAGGAKAERVAVLAARQRSGVGSVLMRALEAEAWAQGFEVVKLHAQEVAVRFYERLGYVVEGAPFVEADIPHRAMSKKLERSRID